ncbi:MAG: serine acetyltransferase [Gammaproteobacteria bacterium]|nr:MAG: serine acetyltransferase [Gammaproteobacteria bacterium]
MNPNEFCKVISSDTPDWSRESIRCFWDPGRKLLRSIRRFQSCQTRKGIFWKIAQRYWVVVHWFWSLMTQCEIHLNCQIDGGLLLPHPTGIIIHPDSRIGANCLIFHQVTLAGKVTLDGHVDIGTGAKLKGPITVGNHVQIGFNAVVTKNIPDNCVVVGIPARIVSVKSDE